jgi:hypothetical protein
MIGVVIRAGGNSDDDARSQSFFSSRNQGWGNPMMMQDRNHSSGNFQEPSETNCSPSVRPWPWPVRSPSIAQKSFAASPPLDFDSVERCLVLDLDSRYDLILGMACLERHEPWIDWRSKTLGATRLSPGGAMASHEPTSARKQKRYWRGHWTESVNVLDIGVSELMDTGVEDASPEHCSCNGAWP